MNNPGDPNVNQGVKSVSTSSEARSDVEHVTPAEKSRNQVNTVEKKDKR